MSNILQSLLDSVLGKGEPGSKGNVKYVCPFHVSDPLGKRKLEINTITDEHGNNRWRCWVCDKSNDSYGNTIRSLFRKMNVPKHALDSLNNIIVKGEYNSDIITQFDGLLPEEYRFLPDVKPTDYLAKHAKIYLRDRDFTEDDIIKYQIGYCAEGPYAERLIFPSYDGEGKMNFFVSRKFDPNDNYMKYKLPDVSRDIIPWEMFINWEAPITLCEGVFDMIAIKRNAIPLLGKNITPKLMKKLITSRIRKLYIALDKDALKIALTHCQTFISHGIKVYLVEMDQKDPADMGFEAYTKHVQQTKPLTLARIARLKMNM